MNLMMEIPNEEEIKQQVQEEIKPKTEELQQIEQLTQHNVSELMQVDLDSLAERRDVMQTIEGFGMATMRKTSEKNELLQTRIDVLSKMDSEGGEVAMGLMNLQKEMKELDPSGIDFLKRNPLIKNLSPAFKYFNRYKKADTVITEIIESLDKGKDTLQRDNTSLEIEELSLRDLTKQLYKEAEMGQMMDEELIRQIEEAKGRNEDPERIKFIEEEVLFPLRQRVMDMQQLIVVNQQGIMALEVVRRNNKELIRGVERAKGVTVTALRTATIVAAALYNQKIVLEKIEALNATTNKLISATSKMLKEQGAQIQKQATEASISPETLKQAFADTLDALESISTYKREALPKMQSTIDEFKKLADEGEQRILRMEAGKAVTEK